MEYTYSLQKYTGRNSRHTCPACGRKFCFTLYMDGNNNPIAEDVGRCEHRNSCGYEKTPKDYFSENPTELKEFRPIQAPQPRKEEKPDYIPFSLIQQSESTNNTLMDYLRKFFAENDLNKITADYHLGSTKKREVIFPQIDRVSMCRTGKVIDYDKNGHRIKKMQGDAVDWLHARLMKKQGKQASDFHLKQCLFGEHLLSKRPNDIVCMTEGEKSTVICSLIFPQFVWVSVGGKQNFKPAMCHALKGRDVIVYPDADAVNEWAVKLPQFVFCRSIKLSDWAKNEPQGSKRDIADLIMEQRKPIEKPTTIGDVCRWMDELGIPKGRITFNI